MSHFYGTLEGFTPRGERPDITRRGGTPESGLEAILSSSEGSVVIAVYEGEAEDGGLEDRVRIWLPGFELYDGPLSECRFESIRTNTQEVEK